MFRTHRGGVLMLLALCAVAASPPQARAEPPTSTAVTTSGAPPVVSVHETVQQAYAPVDMLVLTASDALAYAPVAFGIGRDTSAGTRLDSPAAAAAVAPVLNPSAVWRNQTARQRTCSAPVSHFAIAITSQTDALRERTAAALDRMRTPTSPAHVLTTSWRSCAPSAPMIGQRAFPFKN